jgi:hypothetical protein
MEKKGGVYLAAGYEPKGRAPAPKNLQSVRGLLAESPRRYTRLTARFWPDL